MQVEKTGCEIVCGAPTTLVVKGQLKVKTIIIDVSTTVGVDVDIIDRAVDAVATCC